MTAAEREERILSLAPQVANVARLLHWRGPRWVLLDDLISAGYVGAIAAVDGFDSSHNASLATYANWKIRSAILDYKRSVDRLSRDHRRKLLATGDEAPVTMSLNQRPRRGEPFALDPPDPRAMSEFNRREARHDLAVIAGRAALKPRTADILARSMGGEPQIDIARSEGVTQGRVSQIVVNAIRKLREAA